MIIIKDFYADWCQPCKMMAPVIEELEKELSDVVFEKIDVDKNPEYSFDNGVMSIPTLIVMNDDKEVKRFTGVVSKADIKKSLGL